MTDGMAVELNMKVYLNFWQVTVYTNIHTYTQLIQIKVVFPKV